jgi:viologen exporter family transport system permease protein
MLLQYRAAALAGLWTQIFFGLVLLMIYEAFYRSTTALQPMTFAEVVSYVWLGQALLAMLPWNADAEIRAMVRSGAVAYELCRPIDLYLLWYARALAWRTAPTILRAAPMCAIAVVVLPLVGLGEWRLASPPSTAAALAFGATLICTLLLGLRPDNAYQHQSPVDHQRGRSGRSDDARDVSVGHDRPASAVSGLGAADRTSTAVRRAG